MELDALAAQFSSPSAPYRPMVFWLWNGEITRAGIEATIADFAAKGLGGFFIHPMGEKFRLQDFLAGISPPYLSAEYFALVRYAIECAEKQGLYVWLYDEGGWPSGSAQGQVTADRPELRGQRLHAQAFDLTQPSLPAQTVAAMGFTAAGHPVPLELSEVGTWAAHVKEVFIFTLEPDGYAIDVLNPLAVARFIEVTHERYAETVGDFFGGTVVGMFTDETSLGGSAGTAAIPWTEGLGELLSAQLGCDYRTVLPLLFAPAVCDTGERACYTPQLAASTRCDYYDVVTKLFGEAYWQQLTDWCEGHDLIHTGHVGGEDSLPDHRHFGHYFRTAGRLHAPGVDAIWRQLFPGQDNFPFPRLASSALHRRPAAAEGDWSNLAITETNGVYGYGLDFGQMRWLADYQFHGGMTLYAPMAYYYTTEHGRLYGTMSHMGPGNPLWAHYRGFAETIGRLSLLLRHSVEPVQIGVYYPIEAMWAGPETAAAAWASLQDVCARLIETQQGFDFVDADLLASALISGGALQAAQAEYAAIIVPTTTVISAEALRKLAAFQAAGGTLIILGAFPALHAETTGEAVFTQTLMDFLSNGLDPLDAADLEDVLGAAPLAHSALRLTDPQPDLLITRRILGDATLHLVTNNSGELIVPDFTFAPRGQHLALEAWDLRDGEVLSLLQVEAEAAQDFCPPLAPWSTIALVTRPVGDNYPPHDPMWEENPAEHHFAQWLATPAAQRAEHPPAILVLAEFQEASNIRLAEEYVIVDGSVEHELNPDQRHPYATGPAPLLAWEDWGLQAFCGEVEYTFDLPLAAEFVNRPLLLDLGEVYSAASVWINGHLVGESLWPPHVLEIDDQLRAGDNRLVIRVASTLAEQICREDVIAEARDQGWCNAYLERTLPWMQAPRSGLLGPVRLLLNEIQ